MDVDFSRNSDAVMNNQVKEWICEMFTAKENGADINQVMLYAPLIQVAQNELTSRFVKKTTRIAMRISVLALAISFTALVVAVLSVFT